MSCFKSRLPPNTPGGRVDECASKAYPHVLYVASAMGFDSDEKMVVLGFSNSVGVTGKIHHEMKRPRG